MAYSFEPGSTIRDQISLLGAAISFTPRRRDIHVDSARVTFHIKCLSENDFDSWMSALRYLLSVSMDSAPKSDTFAYHDRKFTPTGSETERVMSRRSLSRGMGLRLQTGKLQQATIVLDEIGTVREILRTKFTMLSLARLSTILLEYAIRVARLTERAHRV